MDLQHAYLAPPCFINLNIHIHMIWQGVISSHQTMHFDLISTQVNAHPNKQHNTPSKLSTLQHDCHHPDGSSWWRYKPFPNITMTFLNFACVIWHTALDRTSRTWGFKF
jgi:hypothetical protein